MNPSTSSAFSCLFLIVASVQAAEPQLSITNTQGTVILGWTSTETNWVLEQTRQFPQAIQWESVPPNLYQTNANSLQFSFPATEDSGFFRLRRLVAPVAGLTGFWPLDEGGGETSSEASMGGASMILSNVTRSAGRIGSGALSFNGGAAEAGGSQAWVSNTGYRTLPSTGRPFGLSLWIKPEVLPLGWSGIAGNHVGDTNGWYLASHSPGPGTNLIVFASPNGSLSVTGQTLLIPGRWHELAITHDGTRGSIYLDGFELASGDGSLMTHDGPIFFGGGVAGFPSFPGQMDEIHAYANALTPEQVFTAGYWSFSENSGSLTTDASIHSNHARLTSATAWADGKSGPGIDLSKGQVVIGNDFQTLLPPTGDPFSVSFWVKPQELPIGSSGLMTIGEPNANGWQLTLDVDENRTMSLRLVSSNYGGTLDLRAPVNWSTGVWSKVDLTHNGGVASVYVDGLKVKAEHGAIRGSKAPLIIGTAPGALNFNGVLDELRVFRRELNPSEIGPVAFPLWETVIRGTSTNFLLQGGCPTGKRISYNILPSPAPTRGTLIQSNDTAVVTYVAGPEQGPDRFAYTVSDGEFTSPPMMVAVSVVNPHWLSPAGGKAEPLDGSSPEHAWAAGSTEALDAIWRTNNYYDCFFYAAGIYQTRGWKYQERSTANPGCKHIGQGTAEPDSTVLRLVDIRATWIEETIFAPASGASGCDGFELHHMVLDCNAANVPKYERGEPMSIRMPLASPGRVDTVMLHWANSSAVINKPRYIGPASEFTLYARRFGTNTYVTNCTSVTAAGSIELILINAEADELLLQLDRRAAGIDFYGLNEIGVLGTEVSLPSASIPGAGESRLNSQYDILSAVDGNGGSSWASGPEEQVEILLPLSQGTILTEIDLQWNCASNSPYGWFGPAASMLIRARDEATGEFNDVPFVRHPRTTGGWEAITFGTTQATNTTVTDALRIVLTARESSVDHYSLKEVGLRNGNRKVSIPMPSATSTFSFGGNRSVMRAFDRDPNSFWACGTQGAVSAVSLTGSNLKFTHLKVKGFGTKAGRESFPMFIMAPRGSGGNILVEDCEFVEPASNNTDGVTVLTLIPSPPNNLTNAVVRRCKVEGMKPKFTYANAFTAVGVENCYVADCSIGVYFEPDGQTDDVGSVLIRSNQFVNVDHGVFLLFHPGNQFDTLTCERNEIVLNGVAGGGYGIGACDTCSGGLSGSITNLTVMNNVIRYPAWGQRPGARDVGLHASDIQHAIFGNNVIVQGTTNELRVRRHPAGTVTPSSPPQECDNFFLTPPDPPYYLPTVDLLPPGYRRAWFNNRAISGALLPIRTTEFGIDRPASQQQWPD